MKILNRIFRKKLFLCLLGIMILAQASAMDVPGAEYAVPFVRSSSLGGLHAALADDFEALFSNPAGFVSAEPELSISRIGIGLSGPVFTLTGLVLKSMDGEGGLTELITSENLKLMLQSFYVESTISGPLQFGFVGNGLGFGLFNTTRVIMSSAGSALNLHADLREQFLLNGGYAFRIPLPQGWDTTLDAGILLKAFINGDILIQKSIFELTSLSVGSLSSEPFMLTSGIGVDTGVLLSFRKLISLGITGRDIYTPTIRTIYEGTTAYFDGSESISTRNVLVPMDLSAGILFTPGLGSFERFVSDLKFMLDYKNILEFMVTPSDVSNPILHAGAGLEITLMDILDLRAGFDQGLFSAGFGLDLTWFSFDAAMYGRELSHEPGLRPVFNMLFSIDFRY